MTPFQYVLPLVSVLVGLALADLAVSLHRLLRARRRVQWDWLPLATAALAALTSFYLWWAFYNSQDDTFYRTLGGFLPFAAQLVVLFLVNAAALPDEVPDGGIDLRAFYDANGPYFWSLYAGLIFLLIAHSAGAYAVGYVPGGVRAAAGMALSALPLIALCVALALFRRRVFHAVAVVALFLLLLASWSGSELGAV